MIDNEENNKISFGGLIIGSVVVGMVLYHIFKPKEQTAAIKSIKRKKRVFVSFAKKDEVYRNYLIKQAKDYRSPFEFIDMSVKNPWPESTWKHKCRTKIKSCNGIIILLSGKTWNSEGARWEVKCAMEESIPVIGMHIFKNNQKSIPPELGDSEIITWEWKELKKIIKTF